MKPGWCAEPCVWRGVCRGQGHSTGSLVPSGAATRRQARGLSGHSEAAQEPWEGQLFAGFINHFFLLLDSLITSIYQVVSQNLSAVRPTGERRGGAPGA